MTTNHPAHGPVSLERLHQIREILSKAAAQSDGGNLGYAMADAVKVIAGAIAAFCSEPVLYAAEETLAYAKMGELHLKCLSQPMGDAVIPLYTATPAPVVPAELHPDTQNLVTDFCAALAEKLYKAQLKYGYDADWKQDGWPTQCQANFHQHIAKGDPRDVAAYCAFMWYHGWKTESVQPAPEALKRLRSIVADPKTLPRRKEWISGQQYSYVLLESVEAMVDDAYRAAMLHGAEPATAANKLPFEQWLSQQTGTIDVDCGCVTTEAFYHWLRVAYEAGNSPVTPVCWCSTCRPVTMNDMRFVVCPECGNKRCPRASDHNNACTGSNDPGQVSSAYPAAPQQEVN